MLRRVVALMGDRGPAPKARTVRDRDSKVKDTLHWDGEVRGFDLPDSALEENETWHPMVTQWWEAFRRSPQAQLVVTDVQWLQLVQAMRVYQDFWAGKARGRTLRSAELRSLLAGFLVSPGDALRRGLEIVLPPETGGEDDAQGAKKPATVTSIEARKLRLMQGGDESSPKQPAKKVVRKAPVKKPAAKTSPTRAPAKKVVAKKAPAKRVTRKT